MSNAQRRAAQRNRRPAKLYFTPENLELELHLRGIEATWKNVQRDNHRTENQARPIPTSGPDRRRAKAAARNAASIPETEQDVTDV